MVTLSRLSIPSSAWTVVLRHGVQRGSTRPRGPRCQASWISPAEVIVAAAAAARSRRPWVRHERRRLQPSPLGPDMWCCFEAASSPGAPQWHVLRCLHTHSRSLDLPTAQRAMRRPTVPPGQPIGRETGWTHPGEPPRSRAGPAMSGRCPLSRRGVAGRGAGWAHHRGRTLLRCACRRRAGRACGPLIALRLRRGGSPWAWARAAGRGGSQDRGPGSIGV